MNLRTLTQDELVALRCDRRYTAAQRGAADRELIRRADLERIRQSRARIHENIWGNINGYISGRKVIEFGVDDIEAEAWLATAKDGQLAHWTDRDFRARAWLKAHQARIDAKIARQRAAEAQP